MSSRPVRAGAALPATALGVAATLLAAAGSWHVSLWSDEVATVSAAERPLADLGRLLAHLDAVHGLYYALMHAWVQLAGTSPVALRAPSALAAGVATAATVLLAHRVAGPRTAVLAGVVVAVLPRVTWAGVEARSFALTIALAAVTTAVLQVAVSRRSTPHLVAYAALQGLAIALNVYAVLLLAAHAVTVLVLRRRSPLPLGRLVVAASGALVLGAPVAVLASGQGGQLGVAERGALGLARSLVVNAWFLGETPTAMGATTTSLWPATAGDLWKPAAVLLALACWALVALAVVPGGRRRTVPGTSAPASGERPRDLVVWALPWLVVPAAALGAAALVRPAAYNPRYLSLAAPAVALLVAVGLARLGARRAVAATCLVVLLAAPVYASQRTVTAKSGSDLVLAVDWLDGRLAPGDAVYFGPRDDLGADGVVLRSLRTARLGYPDAFDGASDVTLVTSPVDGATLFGTSRALTASGERLEGVSTLWVLRLASRAASDAAEEDAYLADLGFRVTDRWDGPRTQVLLLERG